MSQVNCITARSMPFWCVGSPLSDPFGGAVLDRLDPLDVAKLIAWAGQQKYIELTSYHDDDLVPWNPEEPEDEGDQDDGAEHRLLGVPGLPEVPAEDEPEEGGHPVVEQVGDAVEHEHGSSLPPGTPGSC